jgi:GNAT superfamily N-acetyltransferase
MLAELAPAERPALRPLFAGFPGLHGCIDAALDGAMGTVWADDPARPSVAMIHLDFYFLAGDANAPAAGEAARRPSERASIVASSADWEPLLRRVWGERLKSRTRVAFRPGRWDRRRLRGFIDALPDGFALKRIGGAAAARFAELADSLVYNFASLEEFLARGVGFGIEHEGRFVSGCSSFAISPHSLEFEIQTHPDVRRRGLACATAAAMIEHCIDRGLTPEWDAHNEMSSALAEKLGFVEPAPYTAYELRE